MLNTRYQRRGEFITFYTQILSHNKEDNKPDIVTEILLSRTTTRPGDDHISANYVNNNGVLTMDLVSVCDGRMIHSLIVMERTVNCLKRIPY